MSNADLVVLAAGMGSRFGGLKQVARAHRRALQRRIDCGKRGKIVMITDTTRNP